jgi:hypothetical protein
MKDYFWVSMDFDWDRAIALRVKRCVLPAGSITVAAASFFNSPACWFFFFPSYALKVKIHFQF